MYEGRHGNIFLGLLGFYSGVEPPAWMQYEPALVSVALKAASVDCIFSAILHFNIII